MHSIRAFSHLFAFLLVAYGWKESWSFALLPFSVTSSALNGRQFKSLARSNTVCWATPKNVSSSSSSSSSLPETPLAQPQQSLKDEVEASTVSQQRNSRVAKRMKLQWCNNGFCQDVLREKVVGTRNQIVLRGPATGQVVYHWQSVTQETRNNNKKSDLYQEQTDTATVIKDPFVLILIRPGDDTLIQAAAKAIQELSEFGVQVLLDPSTAARVKYYFGVDSDNVHLFEAMPTPGFGDDIRDESDTDTLRDHDSYLYGQSHPTGNPVAAHAPDLICTLGGDGLLMHAGMMFQGAVPPILCVAGGSLGFLTPFRQDEMVEALLIALGLQTSSSIADQDSTPLILPDIDVFPPNMPTYAYTPKEVNGDRTRPKLKFGLGNRIYLSIRMRLECAVVSKDGSIRSRYNVLNEVVVDRGSSPYLAALECFCDDSHLTTVQADGVIFATPTGSTAYSLAAGSSVVHPAVPCILLTPICPHVLSFRSMIFPDHVLLRCYVPEDARAGASVAFDGKHRQELRRGESLEVKMSPYPVPTINRVDQTADWLGNLKSNFNFNARPRQRPLS
ncbi:NAD+ kinase [Fistulifera solaris]|jgi:NAD+ kinase|uniref:NAD+ kinase n=1 Tax=Fistulifera solaris TaxID=1519565 RepID=A0A1Z5K385_FISSO|nr:NAD+ kinase [Fistulifera solaris]|eukprot:GAX20695.1 NAD+ kinase [Fistulifera solaris]